LRVDLRYEGGDARLTLDWHSDYETTSNAFHDLHAQRFGYARRDQAIEVVTLRTELAGPAPAHSPFTQQPSTSNQGPSAPLRVVSMLVTEGDWQDVPIYERDQLPEGQVVTGPACIIEQTACIVIDPGYRFTVQNGHIVCSETDEMRSLPATSGTEQEADPVTLELMGQAFMGLARQMGTVLQRTATSTNIRERLDFSCAVFDRHANLIANAPHIPVHLGAMGETVRHVASVYPQA